MVAIDRSVDGKRVELVACADPYTRLAPGEFGTARIVDDVGTLHVDWDSGSRLGLVAGEDSWRIVEFEVEAYECEGHGMYVEVYVDGEFVANVSPGSALPERTKFHSFEEWLVAEAAIEAAIEKGPVEDEFLRRPDGSIYGRSGA